MAAILVIALLIAVVTLVLLVNQRRLSNLEMELHPFKLKLTFKPRKD